MSDHRLVFNHDIMELISTPASEGARSMQKVSWRDVYHTDPPGTGSCARALLFCHLLSNLQLGDASPRVIDCPAVFGIFAI